MKNTSLEPSQREPAASVSTPRDAASGLDAPSAATAVRPIRPRGLMVVATLVYGAMAALATGWAALAQRPLLHAAGAAPMSGGVLALDVLAGVVVGVVLVMLSRLLTRRTRSGDRMARALAGMLGPISVRDGVALALLSGVAEEMLFRGLLQPMIGWVAASLLFGAAHIAPRRDLWLWTGTSVVAGFALGALFATTGHLVAPIVGHFTVNAANLRWLSVHYSADRSPMKD